MAEKLPQVKSYPVLLSEILSTFQSKIGVNDNNTGSVNLSFFETVAQAIYRSTGEQELLLFVTFLLKRSPLKYMPGLLAQI